MEGGDTQPSRQTGRGSLGEGFGSLSGGGHEATDKSLGSARLDPGAGERVGSMQCSSDAGSAKASAATPTRPSRAVSGESVVQQVQRRQQCAGGEHLGLGAPHRQLVPALLLGSQGICSTGAHTDD